MRAEHLRHEDVLAKCLSMTQPLSYRMEIGESTHLRLLKKSLLREKYSSNKIEKNENNDSQLFAPLRPD